MSEFAASGSSVASGARTSATRSVLKPIACEKSSTKSAKKRAPSTIVPKDSGEGSSTSHIGGDHRTPATPPPQRHVPPGRGTKGAAGARGAPQSPGSFRVDRVREEDRHHRDERLGCGGPDGGEDAPRGALAHLQHAAEPLDAVGEGLRAPEDEREGADDQEDVDRAHRSRLVGGRGRRDG